MSKKEILREINALFGAVRDYDGFLRVCEKFRESSGNALLCDEEGGRPFRAPHIFTCECCGVVIADDDWNCVAFTENNIVSVRPISNDYNVFTFGIVTDCEIYPRLDDDDMSGRSLVKLSLWLGEKTDVTPRSDDESYASYDIGLNRLFTGIDDLGSLMSFCDAAMATMDATSDSDESMTLLSINARIQDPTAHCLTVAQLIRDDNGLVLIAEDDSGEELRLLLTDDRVESVERISFVNNSFYCLQILLERQPNSTKSNYLQLAIYL